MRIETAGNVEAPNPKNGATNDVAHSGHANLWVWRVCLYVSMCVRVRSCLPGVVGRNGPTFRHLSVVFSVCTGAGYVTRRTISRARRTKNACG